MSGSWADDAQTFAFGDWSFELRGDEVADIARGGRIVLRGIRVAVRDADWGTTPIVVSSVETKRSGVTLRLETIAPAFAGTLRIDVAGERFSTELDLRAAADALTNRTGLVVLHPPALAGSSVHVTHPEGAEDVVLPTAISPHQPVRDIVGLTWNRGGAPASLALSGEVFEMEDQRNWTDASFKTYSRPLDQPFPYRVAAGEHVRQTAVLTWAGPAGTVASEPGTGGAGPAPVAIALRERGVFPEIAVGAATAPDPGPPPSASPSAGFLASTVLVELDLASPTWRAALERATASGSPLDVRFVLADGDPRALDAGVAALRPHRVRRVTAFRPTGPARHVSDAAAVAALREALQGHGVSADVIGGARSHFTELNREHARLPRDLDGVVCSVTPLFHERSTAQLIESVAMQRLVARQAVELGRGAPLHLGPLSLRPHFDDVAASPPPHAPGPDLSAGYGPELIDADDARQSAPELAAWTIASAAALAVPGVASLTLFEEWGARGIRGADGAPHPVADAVRALASLSGRTLLSGDSPDGLVWAFGAVRPGGGTDILVANLDTVARSIALAPPAGLAGHPIEVAPFAWALRSFADRSQE